MESRNQASHSHVRGHLVLHVTDHARNPDAFGGQPVLRLAPGESTSVTSELGWYESVADFVAATRPPAVFSAYAAETGTPIVVKAASVTSRDAEVKVEREADGRYRLESSAHGTRTLEIGDGARTEVLFLPLEEVVRRRVAYIIRHQRAVESPGLLAHAFVPVNTRTGLASATNGWPDWSDGSERIAMPLLLQAATARGLADPEETGPLLDGWSRFAVRHLLDETGAPRRGSQSRHLPPRLYDMPWPARFFHDRHRARGREEDLERAARVIERRFDLGGATHLSIDVSPTTTAVCDSLVNYEQAIVAPLLDLLRDAYALTGETLFHDALEERLPWLPAFGGPQPHARLHGIAIRHWDGYWFGENRLWGDVFPHYWSALTATALLRLPETLRTADTDRLAGLILRADMANYAEDGSATCAWEGRRPSGPVRPARTAACRGGACRTPVPGERQRARRISVRVSAAAPAPDLSTT
ncbi:hypothetical protein QWJ26_33855 [Streptomyces sp. CSDS2]|uniref:hypothetical protein n=1 Tax=Streptomyces sp. CSDS2 TaxID=3055051 RepID=UPI0025AFCD67|nr:hypothetical protein [Streptomyces sp. CSDS2]MDN3264702.1 hypothetical protein [Streptomyces sp. CSDS2]